MQIQSKPRAPLFSATAKYHAHRAPVPTPMEDPIPGQNPVPGTDPVPHQDPTVIEDPIPHQDPSQIPNGEPPPAQVCN
jgi:hypothetical protein